ncbi:3'-5' exonuclease [Hydrogenophaga sp.]|uniref:3'-5' exonuclease n=1 Tax=Hydrogenophaga sp. TaxID=1904254 RepID=UPI00260DBD0D|nr:3'-5' exonuclease [Hydrogenophaga sp.]MCW5655522.1 3'-5' exonuclease [Hydrogenophaga sp.]
MSRIAIIDFETTGMTPNAGDRATEVAIVIAEQGVAVDRFQSLMNAGVRVSSFITQLTGITNAMLAQAPPADAVMREAARFVGQHTPMVAHNAAFDRRFWVAELERAGVAAPQPFACTVLLSRRLYPEAPSHRLGALVDRFQLPRTGRAHRALADAEMASELLGRIQHDLRTRHGVGNPDHAFLMALQRCSRAALPAFMRAQQSRCSATSSPLP